MKLFHLALFLFFSLQPLRAVEDSAVYSCGVFTTALGSYSTISAEQNDVFGTCTISVEGYDFTENTRGAQSVTCYTGDNSWSDKCVCDGDYCSDDGTCEIIPAPENTYEHEFLQTTSSDVNVTGDDLNLTELYYGDLTFSANGQEIHFNPQYTYDDSTQKVMIMGNVVNANNQQTMIFEEGDYYMKSWDAGGNQLTIITHGIVQIFIEEDFSYTDNHLNSDTDSSLFIYVGGDASFDSNGGGNSTIALFLYVEGDVTIANNSNASDIYGAITAEGGIYITGKNVNFIYDSYGAELLGFGDCEMCYVIDTDNYSATQTLTPIINQSGGEITNLVVKEFLNPIPSGFSYGVGLDTQDENGNHIGNGGSYTSTQNIYDFGSEVYNYSDTSIYWQTKQSASLSYTDWSTNVEYIATYTTVDGKNYPDVVLDVCAPYPIPTTPTVGLFDAWEVGIGVPQDRNITTKVVGENFTLTIASLDESLSALKVRDGASIQYFLYDFDTNSSSSNPYITPPLTMEFGTNTTQDITFNITKGSYRDVRVSFAFCQDDLGGIIDLGLCESSELNTSIASSDNFAIRPKKFEIAKDDGVYVVKAEDVNISYKAYSSTNTLVSNYNENFSNFDIVSRLLDTSKRCKNQQLSFSKPEIFNDGLASGLSTLGNVGDFNIRISEKSGFEFALLDKDDTPDSQRLIEPAEMNLSILPHHFRVQSSTNINQDDGFTYIANEIDEMAIHFDMNITAQNEQNLTMENYADGCYANPLNINLLYSLSSNVTADMFVKELNSSVSASIPSSSSSVTLNSLPSSVFKNENDGRSYLKLNINFERNITTPRNPFEVSLSDVNISDTSTSLNVYNNYSHTIDTKATMLYARTHVTRQRFDTKSGSTFIYYEVYCEDTATQVCNKALLPNGVGSKYSDDPRWYINEKHRAKSGTAGVITQKNGSLVSASLPSGNHPDAITLTYNGDSYPYKTTMQNGASQWLLYNKYNPSTTFNEFEVEYDSSSTSWSGTAQTTTTTSDEAAIKTNRRTMW